MVTVPSCNLADQRRRCASAIRWRPSRDGLDDHGLDERLAKTAEERDALAADLDRRCVRRDFDLSRVGDEQQRIKLAQRYVETTAAA